MIRIPRVTPSFAAGIASAAGRGVATLLRRAGLAACLGAATLASAAAIRIGEIESLTGREAGLGQQSRKGFALAAEVINGRGGVLGSPVELVVEDVHSKPGDAATAARKLVARDKVVAVLCGGTSTNTLEAVPICQAFRVPLLASVSTNPQVTEKGDYVFRACFLDSFQGAVIARLAREHLRLTRVAILASKTSTYGDGLAREFNERYTAGGGTVVGQWAYSEGEKDFRPQLTAMRGTQPEALFVPGYSAEVALIAQQARTLGFEGILLGGDGWEAPETLAIAGNASEGAYYVSHFASDRRTLEVQEFVQRFQAKFGGETPNGASALAYDALLMLVDAIRHAESTNGTKVREALAATQNFVGVTGVITLDAKRNVAKAASVVVVRHGQPEFFLSISP